MKSMVKKKKITMEVLARMISSEAKKTKDDLAGMITAEAKKTKEDLTAVINSGDKKTRSFVRKEIANLARMTQEGFLSMDDKFTKVGGRFDRLEEKLDKIEKGPISNHEKRIKRVEELLLIK